MPDPILDRTPTPRALADAIRRRAAARDAQGNVQSAHGIHPRLRAEAANRLAAAEREVEALMGGTAADNEGEPT